MKKAITALAACAMAVPAFIWANPDKIEVKHGENNETFTIWVDDLENMTVFQSEGVSDGFNGITVNFKSGETYDFAIEQAKDIKYYPGLLPSSLEMEAEPHHSSITMRTKCADPNIRYSFGALPIEYFGNHDPNEYHDMILDYEKRLIQAYADYRETDIKNIDPKYIFSYQGESKITWFPSTTEEYIAMPGKEYVAYVYEGNIDPVTGLELSHNVVFQKVTAKTKNIIDTDYQISYDVTPNSISAKVTSPDDEPFAVFLVSESSVDPDYPDYTAVSQISSLESSVYSTYGTGDWDDYIYRGEADFKKTRLCSGDSYYIMAVGCEIGVMTTHAIVSDKITIPYPEVTSDCTFDVTTDELLVSEINLNVTPSDNDVRYVTFLKEAGEIENPREYFTRAIYTYSTSYMLNLEPGEGNPYVFTGPQTLNSRANVYGGKPMVSGNDYVFYIVGIDENGTPTTEIKEINYTAGATEGHITFDIEFDLDRYHNDYIEQKPAYDFYRSLYCKITPSDENMNYVVDCTPCTDSYLAMTDDEFMNSWVAVYDKWLTTYQGVLEQKGMSFSSKFDYDLNEYRYSQEYLIFVFAYDGAPTSDLYMYKFNPDDGTLTQLRGPGMEK